MKKLIFGLILTIGLLFSLPSEAHCDDGNHKTELVKSNVQTSVIIADLSFDIPQVHSENLYIYSHVDKRNFIVQNQVIEKNNFFSIKGPLLFLRFLNFNHVNKENLLNILSVDPARNI